MASTEDHQPPNPQDHDTCHPDDCTVARLREEINTAQPAPGPRTVHVPLRDTMPAPDTFEWHTAAAVAAIDREELRLARAHLIMAEALSNAIAHRGSRYRDARRVRERILAMPPDAQDRLMGRIDQVTDVGADLAEVRCSGVALPHPGRGGYAPGTPVPGQHVGCDHDPDRGPFMTGDGDADLAALKAAVPADSGLFRDGLVCQRCAVRAAYLPVRVAEVPGMAGAFATGYDWQHLSDSGEPVAAEDNHPVELPS